MGHLLFLLFISLLYPTGAAIALDSDRDHPAVVDAEDIEINFAKGRWIYRGNVTIQQGTLYMTANEIHLFFDDEVLQRAIAQGQPAVFRQQPEGSDHIITGQAQTIEIDQIENVVIFSGDAKLQQHRDTITGQTIIYHMDTEKMTVRGNTAVPGHTTRLSTSETTKNSTSVMSNLNTRPKIVIQPQESAADVESVNMSSEPSVLSTAKGTNNRGTTEKEKKSSDNSPQFHVARVITAGTAAYSNPGVDTALLGGLSGQMPVKVLEIRNNWARVTVPRGIHVWVSASYIAQDRDGEARVKGHGVRARWLPSTDSRIVGILVPGERVHVLATQNQWKQISLPLSIAAWVPVSQLELLEDINSTWRADWQAQAGISPTIGN